MEYYAPYGSADPNASYVNRNTPGAVRGSVPPAEAIEHPQREIMAVITAALGSGSKTDLTQLDQAIDAKIAAATGGGDTSGYVLMNAARARLPLYPEVLTADGKIPVTAPSTGTVRVPAGYDFLHRGIFNVTTVQADFATLANKTYHLRWNPTDGFQLKDLADSGYNAAALAETNVAFDTGYDSMLVARVVTNASNVATITPLSNKAVLTFEGETNNFVTVGYSNDVKPSEIVGVDPQIVTINFARRPLASIQGMTDMATSASEFNAVCRADNRYQVRCIFEANAGNNGGGWMSFVARA